MFSRKKNMDNRGSKLEVDSLNLISAQTSITGDISCVSDIRIDGFVRGNITSKSRILVGEKGMIEGEVSCKIAEISGRIAGNIQTSDKIVLKASCRVEGDINTKTLVIEPGAVFMGNCCMDQAKGMPILNEVFEKEESKLAAVKTS